MFNSSTGRLARSVKAIATVGVVVLMNLEATTAQAAGSCDATTRDDALNLVRNTTNALFAAVDAYDGVIKENPADARAIVDEYLSPVVDLQGFSKLVLGKYWRRATREQQQRFLEEFRILVLRTYSTALTSYSGIQIEYLPMRDEERENFATVRTLIPSSGGEAVKVNYRLHCRRNIWKIFDVSIAGVSMVTTYRSAFSAEARRSGVEGLIKALEQKNDNIGA